MSWVAIKEFGGSDKAANIKYIYDGPNIIDARIFFGKHCPDQKVGVTLSEIATCRGGKGYIKWLRDEFPKATEELREACEEVLKSY